MMPFRAAAIGLLLLASNTLAASFDCSQAQNFAEKEICRDGYLSSLDSSLANRYKRLLSSTEDKEALINSQRNWIALRNQCTTQKCLDQSLSGRIKALDDFKQEEVKNRLALEQKTRSEKSRAEEAERARAMEERRIAQEQARQEQLRLTTQTAPTYTPSSNTSTYRPTTEIAQPTSKTLSQEIFSIAWKFALIIIIIFSCWAIVKHHRGQVTIYNDYTDAAITNLIPLSFLVLGLLLVWLGLPHQAYQISVVIGLFSAIAFAMYSSFSTNEKLSDIFITLIAKLALITVFYVIMALLLASMFGGARRKGESLTQAEARQRRQGKEFRRTFALTSAGYTFLTAWLCRRGEFTSISECLEFRKYNPA
ncbi:hypothetical protein [Pseudomonas sp. 210_17 TE3656]